MPTWQSPLAKDDTLEIATPVCALVRNDRFGGAFNRMIN